MGVLEGRWGASALIPPKSAYARLYVTKHGAEYVGPLRRWHPRQPSFYKVRTFNIDPHAWVVQGEVELQYENDMDTVIQTPTMVRE